MMTINNSNQGTIGTARSGAGKMKNALKKLGLAGLLLGNLIFPGIAQANLLPTVSIPATLPTGYAPGSNIVLRAAASDKDGTVTQVDFYANDGTTNTLIGSDTVAGWAYKWMGVAAGTYQITAVATDNLGGVTTSAPFTITVDAQYNIAPTVTIPTTLPATYAPGSNIVLRAAASDKDGTVTQVDFYANDGTTNTLIGSDTVAGWAFKWMNVAAGTYQITAVATDNLGGTTTSAPFTITVDTQYNIAPTVSIPTTLPTGYAPGSNIVLRAAASDKDGSVTQVDFYANDGTTNVLVGSDTVAGWAFKWLNVAAGTYQITAVATDNLGGTTTSAPFTITVDVQYNIAPTVSIPATLPATYAPGANIILRAAASDKDGTVTQVDFYANDGTTNTLIGSDTVAGWAFKWMGVAASTYQITAVATDNLGGVTTSAPFTITVDAQYNIAPTVTIPATLPATYAPGSNIVLRAAASDKDGTVTQVDFYANDGTTNVLVGTDTVAGWAYKWLNVAAGTYQVTAVATDNLGGTTTSAPFTITVDAQYNIAPTVSIPATLPATYAPGANIILRAAASDKDGTVTQVDFYANDGTTNTLIGSDTVAGWAFKWMNVAAGTYQITAVATDNLGGTTTSAPFTITVGVAEAQVYYIHADHLDTPRVITDTSGNVVWSRENTDPFNNNVPNENPSGLGKFTCNLGFPGQYFDIETGLFQNYFRDAYDPALGRYTQFDPIGLLGGINGFTYALNNPLRWQDPTGLDTYIVNRDLSAFGDSAHPISDVVTHTFTFSTNPDGSIAHTYSWGNDANLKGWNLDQPIDMRAAAQAIQQGLAQKVAPSFVDPYYRKAFDQLNQPKNEHSNWVVTNNCKKETEKLNDLAWKLWVGGK